MCPTQNQTTFIKKIDSNILIEGLFQVIKINGSFCIGQFIVFEMLYLTIFT
jgi:hypothetical protein